MTLVDHQFPLGINLSMVFFLVLQRVLHCFIILLGLWYAGMHDMSGTTLSNIGKIPQTTIAPVSSTQPVSSQQLPLTSGTIVQSSLGQSIPTTMGQMSIGSMVSGGKPLPGSSSSTGGKPLPGFHRLSWGQPLPGPLSLLGGTFFQDHC
jgi:hypothetical protein